jgi:hypothetical protein
MAAGNNAIGTGAIILSANADGLASGLNTAAGKVDRFGKDVGKKLDKAGGKGGKGGIFGSLLGGVGLGIGSALVGLLGKIPGVFEEIRKKADATQAGPLDAIWNRVQLLGQEGGELLRKGLVGLAPAITAGLELIINLFDRLGPFISAVSDALGTVGFVAVEVLSEFLTLVAEAIDTVTKWVESITGWELSFKSSSSVVLNVLRWIGKAFAYVWDTINAGVGVVQVAMGLVIQGIGWVIKKVGELIEMLAKLADQLPESMRPTWVRDAANAVKGFSVETDKFGKDMEAEGTARILKWGESAKKVDAWFDGVEKRLEKRKAALQQEVRLITEPIKLGGAFESTSKEAYSVVAKFEANSMIAANQKAIQQQMLDVMRQNLPLLRPIAAGLQGGGVAVLGN